MIRGHKRQLPLPLNFGLLENCPKNIRPFGAEKTFWENLVGILKYFDNL